MPTEYSDPIKVMVSSRVNAPLDPANPGTTLKEARAKIKEMLEDDKLLLGGQLFDVDINETKPAQGPDVWERCREMAEEADVVLVLYNGQSGWMNKASGQGICHLELRAAGDYSRRKVRVVPLPMNPEEPATDADASFREYVDARGFWTSDEAKTLDEVLDRCRFALHDAVVELTRRGAESTWQRDETGEALDWSRLDYARRAASMREHVAAALERRRPEKDTTDTGPALAFAPLDGQRCLFVCHAVPAALSVAAAREMVGQPFLHDHALVDRMKPKDIGPVHVIACHRGATEAQAVRQLGFPDALVVRGDFGVYVADDIQKIQLVLLAQCRDPGTTQGRVDELRRWLGNTGEETFMRQRAAARREIAGVIAKLAR